MNSDRDIPPTSTLVHGTDGRPAIAPAGANVREARFNPRLDLDPDGDSAGAGLPVRECHEHHEHLIANADVIIERGVKYFRWGCGRRIPAAFIQRPVPERKTVAEGMDEPLL